MNIFNRSITINVRTTDGKTVTVDGVFLDSYHELCLTLAVEMDEFTIITANGEFRRIPHEDCHHGLDRIPNLVGLRLAHGVRKQIIAAVGSDVGCTHLADLALECVKALVQAKHSLMKLSLTPEEIQACSEEYLRGTCYHYRIKPLG